MFIPAPTEHKRIVSPSLMVCPSILPFRIRYSKVETVAVNGNKIRFTSIDPFSLNIDDRNLESAITLKRK